MIRYLIIFISIAIFGISCKKSEVDMGSNLDVTLVKELGFDPAKLSFEKTHSLENTKAVTFETKEEAKLYFKILRENLKSPYINNVSSKRAINTLFRPLEYVKDKLLKSKNGNVENTTPICNLPWYGDCGLDEVDDGNGPTNYAPSLNHWVAWTGYNVTFTWSSSNGILTAANFNSGLIGFHLGVSWTHQNGTFINYPNSALIYFTVNGLQHYNIIVEGVGTLFTQPVTITGVYNTNTGLYSITIT